MADDVLEEQFAELLLRFKRRRLSMTEAIDEATAIAHRREAIGDQELHTMLATIAEAHQANTLSTYRRGPWEGAPTGTAIARLLRVGKSKRRLHYVRDAYYTLYLGKPPYNHDHPEHAADVEPSDDGDDSGLQVV